MSSGFVNLYLNSFIWWCNVQYKQTNTYIDMCIYTAMVLYFVEMLFKDLQ